MLWRRNWRGKRAAWAMVPVGLLLLTTSLLAQDLSSTNLNCLSHFWAATQQPQRPVTVLVFGDSVADSCQSIPCVTMNEFRDRLGIAGYSWNNYRNSTLINLTNGSTGVPPDGLWFTSHLLVPPQGGAWWENDLAPGGLRCDKVGIFFVAQPGGGAFTFSVSTNGGPWTVLAGLTGYAAAPAGCYTNFDLPLNYYRIRVDSQTGTNVILGPQLLSAHSAGLHAVFIYTPGIGLDQVTNVSLAIRLPLFQALAPDLLIWAMKETADQTPQPRLVECEQWWAQACPNMDVLYIGTPYQAVDTNTDATIYQNTVVRGVAEDYHRAYVDCMTPSVSYPWFAAQGYMQDAVHPNLAGSTYLKAFLWNTAGFFALGANRALSCQLTQRQYAIRYPLSTGVLYNLETSTNLLDWQTILARPGDGTILSTNLPFSQGQSFFRLRLQPGG